MNSKKIFLIASAALMLMATFLNWFVAASSFDASMNVSIPGVGNMSYGASTRDLGIAGIALLHGQIAAGLSLIALIIAFTRFKYSSVFGTIALLAGIFTAFISDVVYYEVPIRNTSNIGIGLWLFLGAALAYSIVSALSLFTASKQPELAYESPQANNYAAEVVTSENRFKKALIVALCLGVVVIAGLTASIMKLIQGQATLAKAAVNTEVNAPTKDKDDPVQALQTLAGTLSKTQPEPEATTNNTTTEDGTSGIHHYGEEEGNYGSGEYPFASTRQLTTNDIANLSKFQLKIMRNEIFARHGYIFKAPDLQEYFSTKYWYHPQHEDISDMLTPLEKTNIDFIKRWE